MPPSNRLHKNENLWVYVDASPKKILLDSVGAGVNIEDLDLNSIRFDLVFWNKTRDKVTKVHKVKAIVEVKECWDKTPVINDIYKVSQYLAEEDARSTAGYVLYYTDKKRSSRDNEQVLIDRFNRVRDETPDAKLIDIIPKKLFKTQTDPNATDPWGFALYRC